MIRNLAKIICVIATAIIIYILINPNNSIPQYEINWTYLHKVIHINIYVVWAMAFYISAPIPKWDKYKFHLLVVASLLSILLEVAKYYLDKSHNINTFITNIICFIITWLIVHFINKLIIFLEPLKHEKSK